MSQEDDSQSTLNLKILNAEGLKDYKFLGKMKSYVVIWINPQLKQTTKTITSPTTNPTYNQNFSFPLSPQTLQNPNSCITIQIISPSIHNKKKVIGSATMPVGDVRFEERVFTLQIWRPSGRAHGLVRVSAWVEFRHMLVGCCCVTGFPIEESRPLNLDECVSRGYTCAVPSAPPLEEEEEELLELGNDQVESEEVESNAVQLLPPLSVIDGKDNVDCKPVPPVADGSNALRSLLIGFLGGAVAVATVLVGNANG